MYNPVKSTTKKKNVLSHSLELEKCLCDADWSGSQKTRPIRWSTAVLIEVYMVRAPAPPVHASLDKQPLCRAQSWSCSVWTPARHSFPIQHKSPAWSEEMNDSLIVMKKFSFSPLKGVARWGWWSWRVLMLFHSSFCLTLQALVALMDSTANLPTKEHSDPLDEREIQLVSHRCSTGYRSIEDLCCFWLLCQLVKECLCCSWLPWQSPF